MEKIIDVGLWLNYQNIVEEERSSFNILEERVDNLEIKGVEIVLDIDIKRIAFSFHTEILQKLLLDLIDIQKLFLLYSILSTKHAHSTLIFIWESLQCWCHPVIYVRRELAPSAKQHL